MAASVDAAKHAVLIAWAIVESENEGAWRFYPPLLITLLQLITPLWFFLSNLHATILQSAIYDNYE